MLRKFIIAILILLPIVSLANDKETLDQLRAKAAAAEENKQPELYSDLARRELEEADKVYNTNADEAHKLLDDSIASAVKAADASVSTGKRLKKTEIDLRKISERLDDIRKAWSFEDRPPVMAGIQKIEAARGRLLDRMFKK